MRTPKNRGGKPRIRFRNGEEVKEKEEVKYLGCHLNKKCDPTKEIRARIANTMRTMKKIDLF